MVPAPDVPAQQGPAQQTTNTLSQPSAWQSFWRTLTKIEYEKVFWGKATRNALGVGLPLVVGYATNHLAAGLIVCSGALNTCFTDGEDPYWQRGRRMLAASALVGFAVMCGTLAAQNPTLAVAMAGIWALAAGMLVSLGQTAADLGVTTLVTMVVYSAQPLDLHHAIPAGLLAFGGGLLETGLALAMWPVRGHEPERRALGNLYMELSRAAAYLGTEQPESRAMSELSPPATAQTIAAHAALAHLAADHTVEVDRYRSLLNQAERMRLGLLALARLRVRILREAEHSDQKEKGAPPLDLFFKHASAVLAAIASALLSGGTFDPELEDLDQMDAAAEALRALEVGDPSSAIAALVHDARYQTDALAGQIRSSAELASHATPEGSVQFEQSEARQPWALRLTSRISILRANMTFASAACRHAVRLATCVMLADAIGRAVSWRRTYWLPMTVAIVLKPDFTTTFSRGVLRVAGTLTGLALATALFHLAPETVPVQIALIAILTLLLRSLGAANYGILTTAVSALVVLLIALTGSYAPKDVILARGLNSIAGGVLALVAYSIWPTWERHQLAENLAQLLDAYREYYQAISRALISQDEPAHELDVARQKARLARTNFQASVDRLSAEPGKHDITSLNSMLATMHRLVHAFMSLEAGVYRSKPVPPREAFVIFSHDVEKTLYFLSASLRGSRISAADFPDLREDHHALIRTEVSRAERYVLVNIETDRVTNSLNTLREQILSGSGIYSGASSPGANS